MELERDSFYQFRYSAAGFKRLRNDMSIRSSTGKLITPIDPVSYCFRPAQSAVRTAVNNPALHPKLSAWLAFAFPEGVYSHQKEMIDAAINGENVISTTPTGSGKSLGFMVPAFQKILADPDARVLALYPLRALNHDQIAKWFTIADNLGIPNEHIQRIDGSVASTERFKKLAKARILLATPDVIHHWFMSSLETPETRGFLANLQLRIVDEVHAYDGVFGTNSMFLFRRMDTIQSMLNKDYSPQKHRQYLGASGTLPEPVENFRLLTGVTARHIGELQNGAPMQTQHIFHARDLHLNLPEFVAQAVNIDTHQTIIFMDSRSAVEDTAQRIREELLKYYRPKGNPHNLVIPYKSGLMPADYDRLHSLIKSGEARVVVATSALEAGIDVDFGFGINIGLPASKTALLQRMGRIGRRCESTFIVSTTTPRYDPNPNPFMGMRSLFDYLTRFPMETPTLYPTNTSLQLVAAFCLRNEIARASVRNTAIKPIRNFGIQWPAGFVQSMQRCADPVKNFEPHEKPFIPPVHRKKYPQHFFSMRAAPSEHFTLVKTRSTGPISWKNAVPVGDVNADQALREYTPGAIVRHLGKHYRVLTWLQDDARSLVALSPYSGPNRTKVLFNQNVTTDINPKKIIQGQFFSLPDANPLEHGFVAHMAMRVGLFSTSFIEYARNYNGSYSYIRPYRYYDDHELETATKFAKENNFDYGPKRHVRYDTYGVILYIPEKWFNIHYRKVFAELLQRAYCEKNGISPNDIGAAWKHASIYAGESTHIKDNILAIYERGGNRIGLLDRFCQQLPVLLHSIEQECQRRVEANEHRAPYILKAVINMRELVTRWTPIAPNQLAGFIEQSTGPNLVLPEGYAPVLEPYSLAKFLRTKTITETVRILCPALHEDPVSKNKTLGYWVQSTDRKKYYEERERWVTVQKDEVGKVVSERVAAKMQSRSAPGVINRFVAAARITTEIRRPALAINLATGIIYRVEQREDSNVYLLDYKPHDDVVCSLLSRAIKPSSLPNSSSVGSREAVEKAHFRRAALGVMEASAGRFERAPRQSRFVKAPNIF
jgi:superfamily II DNA/RNA helicase